MVCTVRFGPILCGLALLGLASTAFASAMAPTVGRAEIVQSAGVAVTQNLSFQTLLPAHFAAVSALASAASISLLGGGVVSLATPSAFGVIRSGGQETLTVRTIGPVEHRVVGGALRNNGAVSVDIGGAIARTGVAMAPGAYHGLLVVVAQYN